MNTPKHFNSSVRQSTLKDVAIAAGVSQSAASVILNGAKSGTRVSDLTRQLVEKAAKELQYRPNSLARSLAVGRTERVSFYSGFHRFNTRNAFYAEILDGVMAALGKVDMNLLMHSAGFETPDLLGIVSNRSSDGLVLHGTHDDPIIPLLTELRVPAVSVCDRISGLHCVVSDDDAGGRILAEKLGEAGHRHVLYRTSYSSFDSADHRLSAFRWSAAARGMRVTEVRHAEYDVCDLTTDELDLIRASRDPVTAIVGWDDQVAQGTCAFLETQGLRVPLDVSVVGYNGLETPIIPKYQLTTIKANWFDVSRIATENLLQLIAGQHVETVTTVPVAFVAGTTLRNLSN